VAYCWGFGVGGGALVPVAVGGGQVFTTLRAGGHHACGLDVTGIAYCWGYNCGGTLGDGTTTASGVPVRVVGQP
jgi:alpha-tubulin suppressor-like RCC1 family protein